MMIAFTTACNYLVGGENANEGEHKRIIIPFSCTTRTIEQTTKPFSIFRIAIRPTMKQANEGGLPLLQHLKE